MLQAPYYATIVVIKCRNMLWLKQIKMGDRDPIQDTITEFVWNDWRKPRKSSARIMPLIY